jgi:hypothetical protein
VGADRLQALLAVLRREGPEALLLEVLAEGPADELFVVADEDGVGQGRLQRRTL